MELCISLEFSGGLGELLHSGPLGPDILKGFHSLSRHWQVMMPYLLALLPL